MSPERKAELAALNAASLDGTLPDDLNPLFLFSTTDTDLLMDIAVGKLDPVQIAKEQLANRGIGRSGAWVGLDQAEYDWGL